MALFTRNVKKIKGAAHKNGDGKCKQSLNSTIFVLSSLSLPYLFKFTVAEIVEVEMYNMNENFQVTWHILLGSAYKEYPIKTTQISMYQNNLQQC